PVSGDAGFRLAASRRARLGRLRHHPAGLSGNLQRQFGGRDHRLDHGAACLRNEFQSDQRRRSDAAADRAAGRRLMIRKLALPLLFGLLSVLPTAADTGVRIVVPTRDIARGETISDRDLTFATVSGSALMAGTVTSIAAAKDMEARRMLHAGE